MKRRFHRINNIFEGIETNLYFFESNNIFQRINIIFQ